DSGSFLVITVTGTVAAAAPNSATNTVNVTVPTGTADPNLTNNSASVTSTITSNGTVSGTKFQDDNANGANAADPADPGLTGWTMRAYADNGAGGGTANDGILQAGETTIAGSTTTATGGAWSMTLPAGR